jgi:hypothetical protein
VHKFLLITSTWLIELAEIQSSATILPIVYNGVLIVYHGVPIVYPYSTTIISQISNITFIKSTLHSTKGILRRGFSTICIKTNNSLSTICILWRTILPIQV